MFDSEVSDPIYNFCPGGSVKCNNRKHSSKRSRLFKIGFGTSVRHASPRPGLWRLHPQKGIFFLHSYWHHRLLHPVHNSSLNAAVCVGQMRLVRGLISFAVSLRNAFSSPARRRRVTLLLIRRQLCCVTSDFDSIGPFILLFGFFFVCGHP